MSKVLCKRQTMSYSYAINMALRPRISSVAGFIRPGNKKLVKIIDHGRFPHRTRPQTGSRPASGGRPQRITFYDKSNIHPQYRPRGTAAQPLCSPSFGSALAGAGGSRGLPDPDFFFIFQVRSGLVA